MEFVDPDTGHRTVVKAIARPCGTCGHAHSVGGCPDCDCARWSQTDADTAAAFEASHRELIEHDGATTLLDAQHAEALLAGLADTEDRLHHEAGWDVYPVLYAVHAGVSVAEQDGGEHPVTMLMIELQPLRLPGEFWRQGTGDACGLLETVAAKAAQRPGWWRAMRREAGIDPADPVVGWAFVVEAYQKAVADIDRSANKDPSLRVDEIRTAAAVDIDGRAYTVIRTRSDGQVIQNDVFTGPAYRSLMSQGMTAMGLDAYERLTEAGMDRAHSVLLKLAMLSRAENEQRAKMRGHRKG